MLVFRRVCQSSVEKLIRRQKEKQEGYSSKTLSASITANKFFLWLLMYNANVAHRNQLDFIEVGIKLKLGNS